MAKFCGRIGFVKSVETAQSVWQNKEVEKDYYGDVLSNEQKWDNSSDVNDDFNINNRISIIANDYAFANFHLMKYVVWMGVKWKIKHITIKHPRIIIDLGGLYNEE